MLCPGCGKLVGVNDRECLSCGRRNPGLFGFAGILRFDSEGVLKVLLAANIGLFLLALVLSVGAIEMRGFLGFLSPDGRILYRLGAAGAIPVFGVGKWSAVLSAGWLHGGLLHILFNMYWLWNLFPAVGEMFGTSRGARDLPGLGGHRLCAVLVHGSVRHRHSVPGRGAGDHGRGIGVAVRPDRGALVLRAADQFGLRPGRSGAT